MIGTRLRRARRLRNLSLRDVAERAEVSEGHLSKIERGKIPVSLSMLHRISAALGVNIAWVFDESPAEREPVSRAGARPVLPLDPLRSGRGLSLERVIPHVDENMLQANIHIVEPGGASEGRISHPGEEVGFVLEGRIELRLGDEVHQLERGDAFHFKSVRPHSYRNTGSVTARIFWVNTPPTF